MMFPYQDPNSITDAEIDEVVIADFPRPIALLYDKMLSTDNLKTKAELCIDAFHVGIETIALALVVRYLTSNVADLNDEQLNNAIKLHLSSGTTRGWVELTKGILRVFKGHRSELFIHELYDMFWNYQEDIEQNENNVWNLLDQITNLISLINYGNYNITNRSTELLAIFRKILRYFVFFQNYELWRVVAKEDDLLIIDIHKGIAIRRWSVRSEDILEPSFEIIRSGQFYICNQISSLLELDPLVIDSEQLSFRLQSNDIGIYSSYFDENLSDDRPGTLEYLLLLSEIKEKTTDHNLVAKFLHLLHQLDRRGENLDSHLPLNWTTFRKSVLDYSNEEVKSARIKFDAKLFIERPFMSEVFADFFESPENALVITGDVGVGKTNSLLKLFDEYLSLDSETSALWIDGLTFDTTKSVSQVLIDVLQRTLNLDNGQYANEDITDNWFSSHLVGPMFRNRRLVVIIDGVNENSNSIDALRRINDFVNNFASKNVKVIVTCRPHVWRYARQHILRPYRQLNYYRGVNIGISTLTDARIFHDSIVLTRYTDEEQIAAFELYTKKYNIKSTSLVTLNPRLRDALRDPLLLGIISRAFANQRIPENQSPDEIIPRLIQTLVADPNEQLRLSDIEDFLQGVLMPHFFPEGKLPVNRLTRNMLRSISIGNSITLHHLITDRTIYANELTANQQFQNLMNTGWLLMSGTPVNYDIHFSYEYLYDYFAGEYIATKLWHNSSEGLVEFLELARQLEEAPYLWGPLRYAIVTSLKSGDFRLLNEMASSNVNQIQTDMIVSIVGEFFHLYEHQLYSLLMNWLYQIEYQGLIWEAIVNIAIECQIEDIIIATLLHKNPDVRALVTQQIHSLWMTDKNTAIRCLSQLAEGIRFSSFGRILELSETLAQCTAMIVMRDYVLNNGDLRSTSLIREIWQPVIARLFFAKSNTGVVSQVLKYLRRIVLKLSIRILVGTIQNLEGAGQMLMVSLNDVKAFFPASEEHKIIFKRLLPHLEAATQANHEPLDDLMPLLRVLVVENRDYLTCTLVLAVLIAHLYSEPKSTSKAIRELFNIVINTYPPTEVPEHPTGPPWIQIFVFAYSNLHYLSLEPDLAKSIVEDYCEIAFLAESNFFATTRLSSGIIHRSSLIADSIVWAYELDLSIGQKRLQEVVQLAIHRQDHDQLVRYGWHICEVMSYQGLPNGSMDALYDYLVFTQDYLKELSSQESRRFWNDLSDKLIYFGGGFQHYITQFALQSEKVRMPNNVRNKLLRAKPHQDVSYKIGESGRWFFRTALKSEDKTIRQTLNWLFPLALETKSFQEATVRITTDLGNRIHVGELFS